jgi:hypothetical protein
METKYLKAGKVRDIPTMSYQPQTKATFNNFFIQDTKWMMYEGNETFERCQKTRWLVSFDPAAISTSQLKDFKMRDYSLFNPIELFAREKLGITLYKNKDRPPGFKSKRKKKKKKPKKKNDPGVPPPLGAKKKKKKAAYHPPEEKKPAYKPPAAKSKYTPPPPAAAKKKPSWSAPTSAAPAAPAHKAPTAATGNPATGGYNVPKATAPPPPAAKAKAKKKKKTGPSAWGAPPPGVKYGKPPPHVYDPNAPFTKKKKPAAPPTPIQPPSKRKPNYKPKKGDDLNNLTQGKMKPRHMAPTGPIVSERPPDPHKVAGPTVSTYAPPPGYFGGGHGTAPTDGPIKNFYGK